MQDIKKQLSQLTDLQREVQLLEDQLANLREKRRDINGNVKVDSVHGSSPNFPYVLRSITVKGLSDEEIGQKSGIRMDIEDVRDKLGQKRKECMEEYKRLTAFIFNIEDSQMRQILTLRYIYGKSFQQIAFDIGETDEQIPRKKHDKFLEEYEKYE